MGKNWLSMLQSGQASKDTLLLASQADSRNTIAKPYEEAFHETAIKTQANRIKINTDIVQDINTSSTAHLGHPQAANEILKLH